jgi:16S rRNA (uracil1498-N3)-methyltransferase
MNIFYTPDLVGKQYTLEEQESKHCIKVLRFSKGDRLMLVDGRGGLHTAVITDPNPKKCVVNVIESVHDFEKRDFHLHIAIAPTKNNDRLEWFLEKATEIGIDEITPLLCEHSERKQVNNERLEKVVISAMKQSLKAYLPKLNNLTNFDQFIKSADAQNKFIAHCEEGGDKQHLMNKLNPKETVIILIGPEGDFSSTEIEKAKQNGFQEISLGKSRLRTETAGVVACEIVDLKNELK